MRARLLRACGPVLLAVLAAACGGGGQGGPAPARSTSATSAASGAPGRAVPVVVDTDLAVDDLVALAFLLSSDRADVRAVTVSGTGEVRCPQGLRVVRGLLAVTGDDDVPVACGRSTPLAGDRAFPTEWRDAADGGWGLRLPAATGPAPDRSAVELLTDTVARGGVTVLTLGPLTDLAEAFRAHPRLAERVSAVVVMGGAVGVPGNVSGAGNPAPDAEWNFYVDAVAAAEVVASGAPVTLVGLDASNRLPVTGDFLELLHANAHTEPATLVDRLLSDNPLVAAGGLYFWDPLAAAVVIEPDLVAARSQTITVLTEGRDMGRTVRDAGGTSVALATRPHADRFETLLVGTLDELGHGVPLARPPVPVGHAAITLDGGACSYAGPATVSAGRMRVTFTTSEPGWFAAIVALTGDLSAEKVLAWVRTHPHSRRPVPGVRAAAQVAPGTIRYVDVSPPEAAVVCAPESGAVPLLGGTFTVS